jgi:hypothetical protein
MNWQPMDTHRRQTQDSPQLLVADLLLCGQLEIWYELFWIHDSTDANTYRFTLYITQIETLPPHMSVQVHFGPLVHPVQLDSTGKAEWTLPSAMVLDPKRKRFLRPIRLLLIPSN